MGMITFMQPLSAGSSFRIIVSMPFGATRYRLLRRTDADFAGADDAGAFPVYEGRLHCIIDAIGMVDGTEYFYLDYHYINGQWQAGPRVMAGTPSAFYRGNSVNVQDILRYRLEMGLIEELKRGTLKHQTNRIPVLVASPAFDETRWPLVTIHVAMDASQERYLGEVLNTDEFNEVADVWDDDEGWLSRWQVAVIGWSKNADERKALREALKRIVVANLPIFDSEGMLNVEFSQQDVDDFVNYGSPVYESVGTLSCLARTAVTSAVSPIREVNTVVNPIRVTPSPNQF